MAIKILKIIREIQIKLIKKVLYTVTRATIKRQYQVLGAVGEPRTIIHLLVWMQNGIASLVNSLGVS